MQDIHQSSYYATYMRRIGWVVEKYQDTFIYIKQFFLIGSVIKIQRATSCPSVSFLKKLAKKYSARSITVELLSENKKISGDYQQTTSPYLPTKTIHIDLSSSKEILVKRFTDAKRRAIKKAIKNNVGIKQGTVEEFIKIKRKDLWPFGYWFSKDTKALWESFPKNNKAILLATKDDEAVAGIFLLFYDKSAYYWMAGSTKQGKKLFVPTLLVYEALLLAKKKKCNVFDFEGVYDERFPNSFKNWRGFTKFKQGFGGEEVYFPKPLMYKPLQLNIWSK